MSCIPVHNISPSDSDKNYNDRSNKFINYNNINDNSYSISSNNNIPFYVSVALVPFTINNTPSNISVDKSPSNILFPLSSNVTFDTTNVDKDELLSPSLSVSTVKDSDRLSYYSTPMSIRTTINESISSSDNLDFDIPILPFWFGGEESLHCKRILDKYVTLNNIKIQSTYNKARRAPLQFIGRVKRKPIPTSNFKLQVADYSLDFNFYTLDEIWIFQRDELPFGSGLQRIFRKFCITRWDEKDGLQVSCTELKTFEKFEKYKKLIYPDLTNFYLYCSPVFGTTDEYDFSSTFRRHEIGFYGLDASTIFYSTHLLLEMYPPTLKFDYFLPSTPLEAKIDSEDKTPLLLTRQDTPIKNPYGITPILGTSLSPSSSMHFPKEQQDSNFKSEFEGDTLIKFNDSYQYESDSGDEDDFFCPQAEHIDEDNEFSLLEQNMKIQGYSDEDIRKKKLSIVMQRTREAFGIPKEVSKSKFFPGKNTPNVINRSFYQMINNAASTSASSRNSYPSSPPNISNMCIPSRDSFSVKSSSPLYLQPSNAKLNSFDSQASTPPKIKVEYQHAEDDSGGTFFHDRVISRLKKRSLAWNSDEDASRSPMQRTSPIMEDEFNACNDYMESYDANEVDNVPDKPFVIDYNNEDIGFDFASNENDDDDIEYISDDDVSDEEDYDNDEEYESDSIDEDVPNNESDSDS